MSEKHLNNTEKAIAYIAKHPGCRSPEISEAIGVPTSNMTAILSAPVQAGYVVACKVECPGKPAMNEYRISATVAEDKVSWAEFRVAKRAKLPLTLAKPKPMRAAPPAGPNRAETPAPAKAPEAAAPRPATPIHHPPVTREPVSIRLAPRVVFMVDSTGQLRIEIPDHPPIVCSREETRDAGRLMISTEPIWS